MAEEKSEQTESAETESDQTDQGMLLAEDLVTDRALEEHDRDALTHEPIAARLAELVTHAEPPVNIALFGPWGAGKTSVAELLRRELDGHDPRDVGFVTYNAWQFGGESLQRNFISHAANELGFPPSDPKTRRFHRGLYESARSVDIDFEGFFGRLPRLWLRVFVVFLILLSAISLVLGLASLFTDEDFLGQIGATLKAVLGASAVSALVFGFVEVAVDTARVEHEQSAPAAEEEFARAFAALVDEAKDRHDYKRLVFFVDELDRCQKEDVVSTLRAVKAFLTHPDCVFVVAADRDVLEEAFADGLGEEVPANEEAPYYSSASEFIDKVFQYQILLPPLRLGKLSGFARGLVAGRERGIWAELEAAPNRLFDRVLTGGLIPSHVRSPRRVKVLLNNFAANARLAQARGIQWLDRAQEIAKLTVLRTEFPTLASDLQAEPRLPSFLLDPPPKKKRSAKLQQLLDRHRLPPPPKLTGDEEADEEGETEEDVEEEGIREPDPVLSKRDRKGVAHAQREQLRRYLRRTAQIDGPRADLLYLEVAGTEYGLADAELGHYIEDLSVDDPEVVLDELRRRWAAGGEGQNTEDPT